MAGLLALAAALVLASPHRRNRLVRIANRVRTLAAQDRLGDALVERYRDMHRPRGGELLVLSAPVEAIVTELRVMHAQSYELSPAARGDIAFSQHLVEAAWPVRPAAYSRQLVFRREEQGAFTNVRVIVDYGGYVLGLRHP